MDEVKKEQSHLTTGDKIEEGLLELLKKTVPEKVQGNKYWKIFVGVASGISLLIDGVIGFLDKDPDGGALDNTELDGGDTQS